ncbi:MAG: GIY-YIG nuclease family protein [Candidatus Babeliales bacterium]
MFYVYILQSINFSEQTYVGYTNNLNKRLIIHNSGLSNYTSMYMPWKIITYTAFTDQQKAIEFERYLKTSSGKVLLNRRLI